MQIIENFRSQSIQIIEHIYLRAYICYSLEIIENIYAIDYIQIIEHVDHREFQSIEHIDHRACRLQSIQIIDIDLCRKVEHIYKEHTRTYKKCIIQIQYRSQTILSIEKYTYRQIYKSRQIDRWIKVDRQIKVDTWIDG